VVENRFRWVLPTFTTLFLLLAISCADKSADIGNLPPNIPSNPSPADGASRVELDVTVSWECSDPRRDNLRYDVYFGRTHSPPLVSPYQRESYYDPQPLENSGYYFWKIVARDKYNQTAEGPLWSFSARPESGLYPLGACNLGQIRTSLTNYNIFINDNYLFIANRDNGLHITDISDPLRPSVATTYEIGAVYDVFVRENHAFLAHRDSGLVILDVSDIYQPQFVGINGDVGRVSCVFVRGDEAYLGGYGGVFVLDISDLTSPSILGNCARCGIIYDVEVVGDYAYILHYVWESTALDVVDISDPFAPSITCETYHCGFSPGFDVFEDYIYIAEWWGGAIHILDISDPGNPVSANSYLTPKGMADISVTGNLAFAANTLDGLKVYDISDRLFPVEICEFTLPEYAVNVFLANERIYLINTVFYNHDEYAQLYILAYEQ
jgi:hypothetical protein